MDGFEIRDYGGDFEDVAAFAHRVWLSEYGSRTWLPLPDAAFFRQQQAMRVGASCLAAYHSGRLVGCAFSFPHSLRIGTSVLPIALISWLTIDPDHGRLALPMIERLRRLHAEQGIQLGIGMAWSNPGSASYRFWTKYAETFPRNFQFLFSIRYWVKMLDPRTLARASTTGWERVAARVLGPALSLTPYRQHPAVRPYRSSDLGQCAQLIADAASGFDWALLWSPERLDSQLASPLSATLVFEQEQRVRAMVNYRHLSLHGREPVRAALLDLWAADHLTLPQRVRLLSNLCHHLRAHDVHAVLAMRCAMMPRSAFAANIFLPAHEGFRLAALWTRRAAPLSPPRTWSLLTS